MTHAALRIARTALLLVALTLPVLPIVPEAEAQSPPSGLVGQWHFDEGTGTTTADSSGNGGTGTLNLGASWLPGKVGQAVNFDGIDDYVSIPHSSALQPTQITAEAWFKVDTFRAPTQSHCGASFILTKGGDTSSGNYRLYICKDTGGNTGYHVVFAHGSLSNGIGAATTLQTNTWYHVAGTYDGAVQRIYLNGVLDGSRTTGTGIAASTAPIYVGQHTTSGSFSYRFDGLIDEVNIYNRALSASEIAAEATGNPDALAYPDYVQDQSGNGRHGLIMGSPVPTFAASPWGASFGEALSFDGVDRDSVTMGVYAGNDPALYSAGPLSIEVRYNRQDMDQSHLVSKEKFSSVYTDDDYAIEALSTGHLRGYIRRADNAGVTYVTTTTAPGVGMHDVAMTYDGTTLRLYLDGVLESSAAATRSTTPSTEPLYLGRATTFSAGGPPYPLRGSIDEFRLSNVARYTGASYTPSSTPLASDGNTVVLYDFDVRPHAPEGLAVTVDGAGSGLQLSWQAPANDGHSAITKYRIYRGTSPASQTPIANVTDLTYSDPNVGYSQTRYYRVAAVNSNAEGPSSLVVPGSTLQPGRMDLTNKPLCSTTPSSGQDYCNSERFGYTDSIDESNPDAPIFTLTWGDFNGHEHVGCGSQTCTFWLEFDLGVDSPATSYQAQDGETVSIAYLERQVGSSWQAVADGSISAIMDAPAGQPWRLLMPGNLQLTHDALATSQDSVTFRLVSEPRPDGGVWDLDLDAAMAQLVAPPMVMVHGWDPEADKTVANYTHSAVWRPGMQARLLERASYVYGQDPWAWSGDGAIRNLEFHGKADLRLSAFDLYEEVLAARADPSGLGNALTYDGPADILAHSLGGLVSRYFIESIIPALQALDGGTIDPSNHRPLTFIEAELNAHSQENMPGQADLVSGLVMLGTPHVGSGQAERKIVQVDLGYETNNCFGGTCYRYYKTQAGGHVLSYNPLHPWSPTPKDWWKDEVGAFRNPALRLGTTSVMADFELMRIEDGNPVLKKLDQTFATAEVPYFLVAGDYIRTVGEWLPKGDGHVPIRSATHGHDADVCHKTYGGWELAYGTAQGTPEKPTYDSNIFGTAYHNDLPKARKVQHDTLVFLAGEKFQVCDNAPGGGESQMAMEGGSSLAMAAEGFAPLSMETSSESEVTGYDAPVGFNFTAAPDAYSMRVDWTAPGSSNGTLFLLATNGTLTGASVELRAPNGAVTSLAAGNTSWASWDGPVAADVDHILTLAMPDAEPGAWSLWVNRTTTWPGIAVPQVAFETPVSITTESDSEGAVGEPVVYRIRLTESGSPVLDAAVALDLVDLSTQEPETLTLSDDGLGADDVADDGVYSATYTFQTTGTSPYLATATVGGSLFSAEGGVAILDESLEPTAWPPFRPLNLTATRGPGGGEITLTWQPPTSDGGSPVTGYDVYRANETGAQVFFAATGNVTTWTDTGLDPDATQTYTVASRNDVGYSRLSNEANATTFDLASAPLNFTATPGARGELVLAWAPPADDGGSPVTNYTVYAGDELGSEVAVATLGDDVLTYTETGLDDNVTRHYKVAAVTLAGQGASSSANATTITVEPTEPRNLTVAPGAGAGELTLAWLAPLDDGGDAVDGYSVYRGNGTTWSLRASVGPVLSYTDSGLGNNATWHYRVAAVNAAGEGAASNAANATTFDIPTAPRNLTAMTGPGAGEITLTWQAPTSDGGTPVANYTVYAGNSTGNLTLLVVLGDVLTYTETGLANDATRYYAVTATNLAGESPQSIEVSVGTFDEPSAPLDLTATAGIGNVTLTWQAPGDDGGTPVTGYNVYRGNASGDLSLHATLGNVLVYVDENATPGTRYYYAVAAVNLAGEGAASGEASARPSSLLLSLPGVPLLSLGASVTVVVCDAGSAVGCAVPGQSHVCAELHSTAAPSVTLACIDHAALPPEVDAALHNASPVAVSIPAGPDSTPEILVTYLHEAALLNPVLAACLPVHPTLDDATWLLSNGDESSATVTLKGAPAPGEVVSLPWLGQVIAAAQGTAGAIPCG